MYVLNEDQEKFLTKILNHSDFWDNVGEEFASLWENGNEIHITAGERCVSGECWDTELVLKWVGEILDDGGYGSKYDDDEFIDDRDKELLNSVGVHWKRYKTKTL